MSAGIDEIKKWMAETPPTDRNWQDSSIFFKVGEMRTVLAELEKAEEERAAVERMRKGE